MREYAILIFVGRLDNVFILSPPSSCQMIYFNVMMSNQGKPEFMGRTKGKCFVKCDPTDQTTPQLTWHSIKRHSQYGGELLAAFELIRVRICVSTTAFLFSKIFFPCVQRFFSFQNHSYLCWTPFIFPTLYEKNPQVLWDEICL